MAFSSADFADVKARVAAQIDEAVQKAKQAPQPIANDVQTDVFA
jgi:TPP-dependent pyruvate/acetoin dehydrogenase alpha subunit